MASGRTPQIVGSLVLNALDLFADRVKQPIGKKKASALQTLAKTWKDLDDSEREQVAEKIGVVAELAAAAIPIAIAAAKTRRSKKRTPKEQEEED